MLSDEQNTAFNEELELEFLDSGSQFISQTKELGKLIHELLNQSKVLLVKYIDELIHLTQPMSVVSAASPADSLSPVAAKSSAAASLAAGYTKCSRPAEDDFRAENSEAKIPKPG